MSRPNTDPTRDQTVNQTPTEQAFTIAEAAEHLGLSSEAVRMRLKRGTLTGLKIEGHWVVYLPASTKQPTPSDPTPPEHDRIADQTPTEHPTKQATEHDPTATNPVIAVYEQLVESQREEIAFLRRELDTRNDELERRDVLLREALGRIPSLPAGDQTSTRTEAPDASPFAPGTTERESAGQDTFRLETITSTRPWWRFWERS